ncbi:MAG: PHP domain-containing protein [Candidatus Shapirobacteria bacterium]|nr:PHP domain-containing protein [Candidatus Shapirobacteria bacterium]
MLSSRFEFHCHSCFSQESWATPEKIIQQCQKNGIDGIALTDHNEITGAQELKQNAPAWLKVVIGEEISTTEGEIIGLFLHTKINAGLSLSETIQAIKKQGGLAILPHPFDRLRSKKLPLKNILKNIDSFDIIETFNGRTIWGADNKQAENYAKQREKIRISGSDAHFLSEYGKTLMHNIDCSNPRLFMESLKKATATNRKTNIFFHVLTKLARFCKK